ncbi:hypothetical protein P873_14650 [Arenimonas composti TR7-09 = DSM 18010]|uniref:Uncharacterized protein n=1 Tax=Arenimonas composti TR7-09 = DSM 18010 TaxID=1121013 RepID=A0A091B1W1_9GAMM|nr:hypothetical protein P873_14650 [Arenimonas composti TR7-09 = DSM 18010]
MASAADFRDAFLKSLIVGYDWECSSHFAEIALRRVDSPDRKFRIEGLSACAVFEDFASQYISQCTLLQDQDGIYLCLDPHIEGRRSDKDNYWLVGASVAECPN